MVGTMQKIKDALTPGHRHHTNATGTNYQGTGTDYNAGGYNTSSGYAGDDVQVIRTAAPAPGGTPVHIAVGTTGTGMTGGMPATGTNTTMARDSTYSSSSSEGGFVQNTHGATTCNVREFTEVEDRPIVKERVERIVEHVPVEKKFVVETRAVGEHVMAGNATVESMGVTENIIEAARGTTCPTTGAVERVIGGTGAHTTYDRCNN